MLILTRKFGESIQIGDEICVHVLEVKGKQVRIGLVAPKEKFPIHRTEIYDRIVAERQEALKRARATPVRFLTDLRQGV